MDNILLTYIVWLYTHLHRIIVEVLLASLGLSACLRLPVRRPWAGGGSESIVRIWGSQFVRMPGTLVCPLFDVIRAMSVIVAVAVPSSSSGSRGRNAVECRRHP